MIDDDAEMEEWFAMTDAERAAVEARVMREYSEHMAQFSRLPIITQYRYYRSRALENVRTMRRLMKSGMIPDLMREWLRAHQIRLVKLRAWRATGVWPGEG